MTTTFDDLLTKAEKAPKPHRDVDVYLDSDAATKVGELEQELAAAEGDVRLGDPKPGKIRKQIEDIQAKAAESLVVLRFRKMPADGWAEITARAPARIDVGIDRVYGYDFHKVCREAAVESGVRLDGDTEETLTPDQWERLLTLVSGHEFARICDAIWNLNEYEPEQRIANAKKASRAGTGATSS